LDKKLKARVVNILRRAWMRDKERSIAYAAARRGRGLYECVLCPKGVLHGPKDVQIDHINSVVPETGATTLDEYVNRLFVPADQLQIICKPHHKEKTLAENEARRAYHLTQKEKSAKLKRRLKKRRK
jgi:hypothetical protein